MPRMEIETTGEGGKYAEVLRRYGGSVEMPHDIPIRVETLDHGMQGGSPSVLFIIELPQLQKVVLAQTSLRLFQMAAYATMARYGDLTEGGVMGTFMHGGTAELTLSAAVDCHRCHRQIPGSCQYCPECGAEL